MSVKIRLNNKRFLGEGLLIGSRLYEGEVQQPAAQQPAAQQPAATPVNNGQSTANQNTTQPQQNQQGNVAQQLQQIYINHFQGLQAAIANDLKAIQGVQWAQNVQPKDQSFNSIMAALQEYMKANIEVAKKAVEASAQQAQGGNTPQNASTNVNPSTAQ